MRMFQNKKNKEKEVIEETKAVEDAKSIESTTLTEEKKLIINFFTFVISIFLFNSNSFTIFVNNKVTRRSNNNSTNRF